MPNGAAGKVNASWYRHAEAAIDAALNGGVLPMS
jgi:hypothetical protein